MRIVFDPAKRDRTLRERGLDFEDAQEVLKGPCRHRTDHRSGYPEMRVITLGSLRGRIVVIVWTPRAGTRRIISMRDANAKKSALW
jgi:uncharacterized DUF497 family protein